jgi:hypothetical protein
MAMAETRKCWRQKVVAEMTTAHLQQFARELGTPLSEPDVLIFLNQHGRAYEMWKQMMHAGEEYVKAKLRESYRAANPRQAGRMRVGNQ